MGEQCQEAVAQKAGDRQRHTQLFGRRESQPDILLTKRRREAGRLEFSIGNQAAISLVDGAPNSVEVRISRY